MIKFPCACGVVLSYPESDAGREVQCPHCSRLNDVPAYSDIGNLNDDGTFKVGEGASRTEQNRLGELAYVFHKGRVDDEGDEIDLRNSSEELAAVGRDENAAEIARKVNVPQYDPETGELIRPLSLRDDRPDPRRIPMAKPVGGKIVSYASPGIERPVRLSGIAARLFSPLNFAVMFFIFVAHVLTNVMLLTATSGIGMLLIAAPFVIIGMLIAHYGNVIDEMGPQEAETLPRPMRHMNMYEDFWVPASQVMSAIFLCFTPMFAAILSAGLLSIGHFPGVPATMSGVDVLKGLLEFVAVGMFISGALIFPAVLLTTTCSGTFLNLRPDRVIGVIRSIGPVYWTTALLTMLTLALYTYGAFVSLYNLLSFCLEMTPPIDLGFFSGWLVCYTMLAVGIYLAHLVCWRLGMIYQQQQPSFPWVFQRFEGVHREADRAELKSERAQRRGVGVQRSTAIPKPATPAQPDIAPAGDWPEMEP